MKTKLELKVFLLVAFVSVCNLTFAQDVIKLWNGPAPGSEK